MYLEYTIERADEYQPLPHHRRFYTATERASGGYIVFSNDGDSALCDSMGDVLEWIEHNSFSRGFGNEG